MAQLLFAFRITINIEPYPRQQHSDISIPVAFNQAVNNIGIYCVNQFFWVSGTSSTFSTCCLALINKTNFCEFPNKFKCNNQCFHLRFKQLILINCRYQRFIVNLVFCTNVCQVINDPLIQIVCHYNSIVILYRIN